MSYKRERQLRSLFLGSRERERLISWLEHTAWVAEKEYRQDKEYMSFVQDIMESPVFQSMDRYIQHGNTTTKAHCIQVSYVSYRICKNHSLDYAAAARAGLLHDLFLYDWHTKGNHIHGFTHPRVAMNNARKYFDLTLQEQNIILRHMWPLTPIPPRSKEGLVIVYADKFCSLYEVYGRMKRAMYRRVVHA